jgi:hypothetical protein
MPEAKTSIQWEDTLSKMILLSTEEPSNVAHVGNSLDPKAWAGPRRKRGGRGQINSTVLDLFKLIQNKFKLI